MDATATALLKQLTENLEPLKGLNTPSFLKIEFWSSLIPSLIALLIAGGIGKFIKPHLGIKPKLEILGLQRFLQGHQVWRIAVINNGLEIAKNVQVDVVKIYDGNVLRENFLPMPLPWTHRDTHPDKENRNILPKQTVYLDVFYHKANDPNDVHIATRFGGDIDNFRKLKNGKSKLVLTFFEQSGGSFNKEIEISWPSSLFLDARLEGKKWVLTKNGKFIN